MQIDAAFDSGNIEVIDASDPAAVRLRIRPDAGGAFYQWFHFRAAGRRGEPNTFLLENAAGASYPGGWEGYRAVASHDQQDWFRVDSAYHEGVLRISHTPASDLTWYAYFVPYTWVRHQALLARCAAVADVRARVLGHTLDGRSMDLLEVGALGEGRPVVWVIARQHPGESMAEWWMEGFLGRLLDPADPLARVLRERAAWRVVPNMNPDGSVRGHLRTNACGANLNREWHAPTMARSPEVKLVRDEMDRTGVAIGLDVHGDETLPYNFIAGAEGIPGWNPRQARLHELFCDAYAAASPDFQRVHGYPVDAPGEANMTMCTSAVAARFDCLAMTLEMPFKDNAELPDPAVGWSPGRAMRLGAASLDAFARTLHAC
ncbi:MAG: M14-type cytosolic carboxypeptidase [Myxococcota bacterium]|nr:M14-type cytosolic carboxypeptidase [Myxococcota bacterium]